MRQGNVTQQKINNWTSIEFIYGDTKGQVVVVVGLVVVVGTAVVV